MFKDETAYKFYLLNEVFVNEPFVKCELKFFVVFTNREEVEGIKTGMCQSEKKYK